MSLPSYNITVISKSYIIYNIRLQKGDDFKRYAYEQSFIARWTTFKCFSEWKRRNKQDEGTEYDIISAEWESIEERSRNLIAD